MHLQAQVNESGGPVRIRAMLQYAKAKWTIKGVIGHLLHTERVFANGCFESGLVTRTSCQAFDAKRQLPER
jgi:hypothetical protein